MQYISFYNCWLYLLEFLSWRRQHSWGRSSSLNHNNYYSALPCFARVSWKKHHKNDSFFFFFLFIRSFKAQWTRTRKTSLIFFWLANYFIKHLIFTVLLFEIYYKNAKTNVLWIIETQSEPSLKYRSWAPHNVRLTFLKDDFLLSKPT